MKTFLRLLHLTVDALLALLLGALVFLLATEPGARLALREAENLTGRIHAEDVSGTLWGPLHLRHLRYEDRFVRVELDQVRVDWSLLQLLRGELAASSLRATTLRIALKPRPATADRNAGSITRLPIDISVDELRIGSLEITGAGSTNLRFGQVALAGSWRGEHLAFAPLSAVTTWVGAVRLDGTARMRPDGIDFAQTRFQSFVDGVVDGHLGYRTDSDLHLVWQQLHWPVDGEPVLASDGGTLRWQGPFDDARYALRGRVAVAGQTLDVTADGGMTLQGLHASQLRADSGHGRFDGQAGIDWQGIPTVSVDGRIDEVDPQQWTPALQGKLNGALHLDARFPGDAPSVQFRLALDQSRLNDYPLTAELDGRYAEGRLQLDRARATSGASRLQASGEVWPAWQLQARLDSSNLASLWRGLSGSARLQARLDGPLQAPRIRGQLHARDLDYVQRTAKRVDAAFDLDPEGTLQLDAQLRDLDVGQPIDNVQLRLRGSSAVHRLEAEVRMPQGRASAVFDGGLDLARRSWAGTLTNAHLEFGSLPPWALDQASELDIDGTTDGIRVRLAPACFESSVARACGALRPVDDARRIAFRLERFDLAALNPWLAGGAQLSGQLDGFGYTDLAADGIRDLRLDLRNGDAELRRGELPPLKLGPGSVTVHDEDGRLQADAELPFEGGGVTASASLAPGPTFMQRPLDGTVHVDIDSLAWLSVFNYELENVTGTLAGDFRLGGTPALPQLDGQVELADGALTLRSAGIRMQKITATLRGNAAEALDLDAQATSGDGTMQVTGTVDPWQADARLDLHVTGKAFQAMHTPDAAVWVSPDLTLALQDRTLRVDGTVEVPRARITPRKADKGVGPSPDQVVIRRRDDGSVRKRIGVVADVRLRLGDDVSFSGMGLNTQLTGAVRVQQAPGVPTRARGEVQLVGGRYKAYGQDLTLETGRLLFNGGSLTRPAVELKATRSPTKDVTVGVLVRGTLDKPEFSLFSTPAMPQERQLSWLVLGRQIDQTGGSQADKAMMAEAAMSLGLAGSEWLAQRLGKQLSLDEVSIGSRPGQTSEQAQFTVGKYLSPKLFISYGVSLFQPGQSFRLQYDIGAGFKLETETGTQSGGDLVYTIEH